MILFEVAKECLYESLKYLIENGRLSSSKSLKISPLNIVKCFSEEFITKNGILSETQTTTVEILDVSDEHQALMSVNIKLYWLYRDGGNSRLE